MSSNTQFTNKIRLVKGDITKQPDMEAVVSILDVDLKMDGTLNKALVQAAGAQLDEFILENIYRPRVGDAFAVPAFNLPNKHIIFVVIPTWLPGLEGEDRDIINIYRNSLRLAHSMMIKSVAFPALGVGKNKFPVQRAARLALQGIEERQAPHFKEIRIVCNHAETYNAFAQRMK